MKLYEWKLNIITQGVDFSNYDFTSSFMEKYKFKSKKHVVTLKNRKVYNKIISNEIIPSELYLIKDHEKSLVKTRHNEESFIKLKAIGNLFFLVNKENQENITVSFVEREKVLDKDIFISGYKYKVSDFLNIVGKNRIGIMPFNGCWNWNSGQPCLFCDYCAKQENERCILPSTNNINHSIEEWWYKSKDIVKKGIKLALKEIKETERFNSNCYIMFISGSLPDNNFLWKIIISVLEYLDIGSIFPNANIILNVPTHNSQQDLDYVKSLGVNCIQYNIEVFGEEQYQYFCPGKVNYNLLIKKMLEAVNVFGKGFVRSNIVLGLQSLSETKKGIIEFSELGIAIDYSIFQPKPGTTLAHFNPPNQEYILDITKFLSSIYRKNNFSPIFDRYSSRSSIINEVFYDEGCIYTQF